MTKLYADDVKLYKCIEASEDCSQLQNSVDSIFLWANHTGLNLNINKCKSISFFKGNSICNYDYSGEMHYFEKVQFLKDLGVMIDKERPIV